MSDQFKIEQRKFFDRWVMARKKLEASDFFSQFFTRFYNIHIEYSVVELVNKASVRLLLDCGCGTGELCFLAASKKDDIHIIGIDISRNSIQQAQSLALSKNTKQKLSFIVGDIEKLPFRQNVFDATLMVNVLHHLASLQRLEQVLEQLHKTIKKRKYLLIIDCVLNNPLIFLYRKFWSLIPDYAKHSLTEDLVGPSGEIPFKLPFTAGMLRNYLALANFNLVREERQHLFIFIFYYMYKVIHGMRRLFPASVLFSLYQLERVLLERSPVRALSHVITYYCECLD